MVESPPLPVQDIHSQNRNPNSESESPSHTHHPQIHEEQDQDQNDDVEEEGMSFTQSPVSETLETKGGPHPSVSSVRRGRGRKKGMAQSSKKIQLALKKLETLKLNFNPVPFVPGKVIDFSRYEVFLRKLGLWDFSQIEFDRSLRDDLVAQVIVNYNPRQRCSHANELRIGVNRADFGRALKLPVKKAVAGGDGDDEEFSAEFLVFLNEFVSNWMLLHEDSWITPSEVVNWLNMIKDGRPEKVDWAGLVWFMVEKELAQGANLKDCYYAYHLQHLIKMQKEELFKGSQDVKVDLTVEDDDDGGDDDDVKMLDSEEFALGKQKLDEGILEIKHGKDCVEVSDDQERVAPIDAVVHGEKIEGEDVKMLDPHELSLGGQKLDSEENLEVRHGQDRVEVRNDSECVPPMDVGGHGEKVEEVDDTEKVEELVNDKVEKLEDVDSVENAGDAQIVASVDEVCIAENAASAECVKNFVNADENVDADEHALNVDDALVDNVIVPDEHVENIDDSDGHVGTVDEHVGAFDNNENVEDESNMMDYEQGSWLLDGKNGGQHFLQRCSEIDAKLSIEESRQDGVNEDIEHGDIEEHGHVEGFRIMQKGPLDGISEVNLMQDFDVGQLQYPSEDLDVHTSLDLMSSRVGNNMMLGGPSMFNRVGKREIDHEEDVDHHALNESHKKLRMDESWGHKSSDFEMLMDQILHMVDKAKMVHEAEKEEAYEQGSMNQQFIGHELARKDNEIMMLRCKVDELERRRQTEIHRLDRELYLMNSVISGYRKALKGTQKQFSEYRKRYGIPDEPVYKDAGSGGVVKSVMELEKDRIKEEHERKIMCYYLEEEYKKQLDDYESQWREVVDKVQFLDDKLLSAAREVDLLKEWNVKRNTSGITETETEE